MKLKHNFRAVLCGLGLLAVSVAHAQDNCRFRDLLVIFHWRG